MKSSRLVALLVWLQQRGGAATAQEAADELEVSVRTVYRDVAALLAAGVPLWTETGPRGGIRLLEGWRTRLDGLSGEEADSLFLAGAGAAADALGLGTVLAAAQTKLLATMPPELRSRASRIRSRFLLDAPQWFHREEALPCLPRIAEAVWAERRLTITYQRGGATVTRQVDPLGLVFKAGIWYLVASAEGDLRTYRVSRVVEATMEEERFEHPPSFDLAAWWATSTAAFNADILRDRVRLRVSRAARHLLPWVVDSAAAAAALQAAPPPDAQGWITIDLAVESEEVALSQIVALGAGVEVLHPPSLRLALADVGREIARLNA